jgi:hypothetical protein
MVGAFGILEAVVPPLSTAVAESADAVLSAWPAGTAFGLNTKYAMSAIARISTALRTSISPSGMLFFLAGAAAAGFFSIAATGGGVTLRRISSVYAPP